MIHFTGNRRVHAIAPIDQLRCWHASLTDTILSEYIGIGKLLLSWFALALTDAALAELNWRLKGFNSVSTWRTLARLELTTGSGKKPRVVKLTGTEVSRILQVSSRHLRYYPPPLHWRAQARTSNHELAHHLQFNVPSYQTVTGGTHLFLCAVLASGPAILAEAVALSTIVDKGTNTAWRGSRTTSDIRLDKWD